MAHSDTTVRRRVAARVDFPRLVAATTVLVLATVLLGVATKATGSGLACNARWPVCDGGFLNLFPQSFPSFFEWIHRVVAGVTGFAILGTAWVAWRADVGPWTRRLVGLGLVLLPIQVLLGRETVLQFTLPILTAHFWTAFTIFASFVAATVLTWRRALTARRLRNAAAAAAVLVPLQVLLHPPVVTVYTPPVQTTAYVVTMGLFALLLAAAIGGRSLLGPRAGYGLVALAAVHPLLVAVGRNLFAPGTALFGAYLALAGALALGLAWAAVAFHRAAGR